MHAAERSGSLFIIAFVESSHQLMDNHHKVDIKMDYLTPRTDNSFIILRLAVALVKSCMVRVRHAVEGPLEYSYIRQAE